MTIFSFILSLVLITSTSHFLSANASTESDNIIQIPSEPTDFPGNNQDILEIMFAKATISSSDAVHVTGSIKNTGQNTLRYVDVTAHFFDENNKTVGVTTCCYADPEDIEPGHTSSFDSFSNAEQMIGEPKYFRLSFDWQGISASGNDKSSSNNLGLNNKISCGDIPTDLTLTSNIDCTSDGLNVINQDGLTINLNNYTISGPGIQADKVNLSLEELNAGIRVQDSSNVIIKGPGTIKDFDDGILIDKGESNQISRVTFTQNEIAIFDVESGNTIVEDNLMFGNNIGYAGHSSTGTKLTTNLFKSNDLAGVSLVSSTNNELLMNTIQGSVTGIFLDGQSTENNVNSNNVLQNRGVDLNNANGLAPETNENVFLDNKCNTSVPDGLCLGR